MNKQFLAEKRKSELEKNPKLAELEQWGQYCYLPLDVPRFEYPEFVKWFLKESKPIGRTSGDDISDAWIRSTYLASKKKIIQSLDVFPDGKYDSRYPWTTNIRNDFIELFPEFYNRLLTDLPFKKITRMRFWSSKGYLEWHRDDATFIDGLNSFRIMLYDENPEETIKLLETVPGERENFNKQFIIPRIEDTNTFAWNNLRTKHSSVYKGHTKILVIIENYELDFDRYKDLITRSIEKYKALAMISNRSLDDYIEPVSSLPS
jgi:hypothetical protein